MYSFYFFLLSHRVEGTQKSVSLEIKCWLSPSHWMHRPAESESGAALERWVPSSMREAAFTRALRFSSFLTRIDFSFPFSVKTNEETNITRNATLKCKPNYDESDVQQSSGIQTDGKCTPAVTSGHLRSADVLRGNGPSKLCMKTSSKCLMLG